jgi:transcriptional regulator with XRE-family HTH domain
MRNKSIDSDALSRVVDYRQFIMTVLRQGAIEPARGRLAALARNSGLSRSFLTEVLNKKKRLTADSVDRIANGLKLNSAERKLFEALVAIELPEKSRLRSRKNRQEHAERLEKQRKKVQQKSRSLRFKTKVSKDSLSLDFFMVYAALGTIENGATIAEIQKKTKLTHSIVEKILNAMAAEEWIKTENGRFYASERAIDLNDLGLNNRFLNAFSRASAELSRSAPEIAKNNENLVFFTAIPLSVDRVSAFRLRLQAAVLEVIDEFQDDTGSVVKKITLGVN